MICAQCGAGLSQEMVQEGACGFCGTVIEDIVAQEQVENVVRDQVASATEDLRRELKADHDRTHEAESVAVVAVKAAASEAGRTAMLKVWGCGAGCLSTVGTIVLVLIGLVIFMLPQLSRIDLSRLPVIGKQISQPDSSHRRKSKSTKGRKRRRR